MKKNINKIYNVLLKIFSIVYLLFAIFLFIINFNNINIYNFIGLIISIILLLITLKFNKKNDNKIFIILLIITILSRISLFFIDYTQISNEYSFFYYNSISYSNNMGIENSYIAMFPHLYTYIFLLGNVMKIVGTNYTAVILLNLIFEIIGAIFFYLLIKKLEKYDIKKSILLYLFNPFNILWTTICFPVIVPNTMFIIIVYVFTLMKKNEILNKKITYSIILGIILGISNTFRPIVIIYIIALIIWFILKSLKQRKITRDYYIPLIVIISIYILSNLILNNYISNKIEIKLPDTKYGWTIYVGSNYDSKGMWNQNDSLYMNELYSKNDNERTHKLLLDKGIERYKKLNVRIIPLVAYKANILGNDFEYYTLNEYNTLRNNEISKTLQNLITILLSIYLYYILLSNIKVILNNIKNKKDTHLYSLAIYTLGLFISILIVEVSRIYFMSILIPIIIYSTQIFEKDK